MIRDESGIHWLLMRRIELSVPELCSLWNGIPSVVLRKATSELGWALAAKTDCNQVSTLRVSEGLKKLPACAVGRRNRILHAARDLIDSWSQAVLNVVL